MTRACHWCASATLSCCGACRIIVGPDASRSSWPFPSRSRSRHGRNRPARPTTGHGRFHSTHTLIPCPHNRRQHVPSGLCGDPHAHRPSCGKRPAPAGAPPITVRCSATMEDDFCRAPRAARSPPASRSRRGKLGCETRIPTRLLARSPRRRLPGDEATGRGAVPRRIAPPAAFRVPPDRAGVRVPSPLRSRTVAARTAGCFDNTPRSACRARWLLR